MEKHFNPKPSEVMQRFSFHSRMRTANKTVVEYVAALRRIAADCNFGNQLDENLRDRLVCGVNDCAIQRRLLSESNLDLTKALAIATAAEATTRHLSHLQATNSDKLTVGLGHTNAVRSEEPPHARGRGTVRTETDRVTIGQGRRRSETRTRYRCGDKGHIATDKRCRARKSVCSQCGQVGHIAQVCRSKGRFWKTGESRARDRVHQPSEDEGKGSEGEYELRWIRAREGRSAVNLCGDTASRGARPEGSQP